MRRINLFLAIVITFFWIPHTLADTNPEPLFTAELGGTKGVASLVDDYIKRLQMSPVFQGNHDLNVLNDPLGNLGIKSMATSLVSTALNYPDYFSSDDMKPMFHLSQTQWREAQRLLDSSLIASNYSAELQKSVKQRLMRANHALVYVETP